MKFCEMLNLKFVLESQILDFHWLNGFLNLKREKRKKGKSEFKEDFKTRLNMYVLRRVHNELVGISYER